MKKRRRVFLMIMALSLVSSFLPSTGRAQNSLTHTGQPADRYVVLQNVESSVSLCANVTGTPEDFVRVFSNGADVPGFFRIPAGQTLVVTDFDWFYDHPDGASAAGKTIILRIWVTDLTNSAATNTVAFSTIVLNNEGKGGASEHLTSGFVVSSQATICVDRDGAPANVAGPVSVRGYLLGR
jgi:hypothetical protein